MDTKVSEVSESPSVIYDTIIVGAGVSGLQAAQHLNKGKAGKVLVLEGRDRAGGRLYSMNTGQLDNLVEAKTKSATLTNSISIEAGANWVHGKSKRNPIFRMAKSLNLPLVDLYDNDHYMDPQSLIGDRAYYETHGTPRLFTREELLECDQMNTSMERHIASVKYRLKKEKAGGEKKAMNLKIAMMLALERWEASRADAMSEGLCQLVAFYMQYEASSNAMDFDSLRFSTWYQGAAEDEDGEAVVMDGISQLIPSLTHGVDIQYNCCVEKIEGGGHCNASGGFFFPSHSDCSGSEPIKITATTNYASGNGVSTRSTLVTRNVIVTAPMGCLKNNMIEFCPPLPPNKQTAIETMGVGLLEVIVFRFEEQFWPEDRFVFGVPPSPEYSWSGNDPPSLSTEEEVPTYPPNELFYSFLSLSPARSDGCPLLLAYVSGRRAVQVESMTVEAIAEAAVLSLRMIFGNEVLQPVGCSFHRWGKDPFSRGSYTACGLDTTSENFNAMASPMCCCGKQSSGSQSCLQFAGEGTDFECMGLLQGAYNSGVRAAEHIIKYHKAL